jgi:hypothetical protein
MDKKNVQKRKTFFQFGTIKYRSSELWGSLKYSKFGNIFDTISKGEK